MDTTMRIRIQIVIDDGQNNNTIEDFIMLEKTSGSGQTIDVDDALLILEQIKIWSTQKRQYIR